MELNSYNENEEGVQSPKRGETTHLRVQELPKLSTPHRKENDITNLDSMEINPNKVSGESNIEINPTQRDESIVPVTQTLANQTIPFRIRKEKSRRSLTLWDISNG